MSLGRKALVILAAYVATVLVLIPMIWAIIYLLSFAPSAPKIVVYVALAICVMTGVGLLRWFRVRIESRMQ
ncbi:hypothetical protein [Sphingobium nicotianae]|uniref:Uncharacterized protein n=1 Tax=Sphingobium nicotianae TaxID=2782607 RepID=A0A9X1DCT5_9SPHN|nr:hypothetical protein [Sphingobium nicotianae]MBT2187658.1 hypothetical protein [Sphingobium nicotianae]